MDRIDREILQCCLMLKDLFPVGIQFDPSSISQWDGLKRSDSGYRKLCETEEQMSIMMGGLISIDKFMRFEFRNAVINHIASFIFMSTETGGSKTKIKLGFMNYNIGRRESIPAISFQTPFIATTDTQNLMKTLKTMAEMCDQKTPCSSFRKFVYGMFPRLKRVPATVLELMKHCPSLNTDTLTRLYVNEDGFQKTSDSSITYVKGDVAVAWFIDGQNVTMIPTDRNRAQKGISQLATYVYLVKYDKYDEKQNLWHKIIVGWMGFAHSFGIVYESVEWDEDYGEAARKDWVTRDTHIQSITDSYNAVRRVFREGTVPLMLSQIFWGLMYVHSSKGYVDGLKPRGINTGDFITALAGDLLTSLETLTIIASRSFVTPIPDQMQSKYTQCYRFKAGKGNFEWKLDKARLLTVSFGFVD